ncbi:MAG: prolipoprotein diacylglyceryl transferase [Chlamydiales bacterium]|nr:prolipoprotein diacylglyceryl transferase [Chlamydiia bacterium]MCP5507195.1 prolipoprotein diacylglyceryl transferase [Chlamydiales bacterium]
MIAWLYWNPQREAFTIPIIDWPVVWYGVLFVLGLLIGYFIVVRMFIRILGWNTTIRERDIASWDSLTQELQNNTPLARAIFDHYNGTLPSDNHIEILAAINAVSVSRKELEETFPKGIRTIPSIAVSLSDRLTWFVVIATIVGARLGHVFFYQWDYFSRHPIEIFMTWKGGLASHGGAIGIIIALAIYAWVIRNKFPEITFLRILDIVVVPAALVGTFIRVGNFINQEIVGTPSQLPWAVIFADPAEGVAAIPRHPVQLYEGAVYLAAFALLMWLWNKKAETLKPGTITGIFFILIFASRFFLEFFKVSQGGLANGWSIQTGQLLSIPFVILGIILLMITVRPRSPH